MSMPKIRKFLNLSAIAVVCFALLFFMSTQIKTCVTCDGVIMKTVWDTYVCVDESVLKDE